MDNAALPVGKLPFELLGSLLSGLTVDDESVIVGPGLGRDAAVIDIDGTLLVIKNDPITFVSQEAALYLVNVNANDLSCLGATPRWMLVTALLPESGSTPSLVSDLFRQLTDTCKQLGIALIGGHTEVTAGVPRPILVGTLIGTAGPSGLLYPGQAQRGDRLLLARPAGIEGTALLALERPDELTEAFGPEFVTQAQRLLHDPGISVVPIARALLETGAVTALHDPTEGGVATGVREIAAASGLGAVMDRGLVPLLDTTTRVATHFQIDPLGMLSSGTLLAAISPANVERVIDHCADLGIETAIIGKLTTAESGFHLIESNRSGELPTFQTDEVTRALAASH
ncbi:MAG: hydrogenase expression protein [Thermomicrobiales bacterium]|nr:MAG: hydrogenase expression protein [Thermomicrobiales bacterium]